MALKFAFNALTGQFDLVQDLSSLDTTYAKLDGTNQPFTGDVKLDTLKSKSILATDANGKIIEGSFPSEADSLATVTTRGATTTNRITTGNHTITDDGSASLTVNAVPAGQGGIDVFNKLNLALDASPFVDTALTPKTVTNNGVTLSTDSADFNGSSAYLSIADSDDFYFATGDMTIDFRVTFDTLPANGGYMAFYAQRYDGGNYIFFSLSNSGGVYTLMLDSYGAGVQGGKIAKTITLSTGVEYHICVVRHGTTFTLYKDGTSIGSTTDATALPNVASDVNIGRFNSGIMYLDGKIRWFRVSKGIARWTSNFTPPTAPYDTAILTPTPQIILKGSGIQKAIIETDGADSDKIKIINASNAVVSTLDQSGNQIFAGAVQATDATLTGLTLGSVPFVGTGGLLSQDNTKLFWDDTNKRLGIGTTSPIANLHVVGTIRATNNIISARGAGFRSSDGYEGVYLLAGGNLKLRTNTTDNAIYLLDTGNVGIGNATPDRKLTVTDISGSAQIRLSYDAANYAEIRGGATGALYFTSSKGFTYFNAAGKDNKFYAYDYSSTGSPYLYLSAHTLRLNAGMIAGWGTVNLNDSGDSFLTGGNVGIGTTSPKAVLHLKAGTSTAYTAPLKFTSGTLLGTAEAGAVEFLSDDFFATITTGAARKGIILDDGSRLTSGKIPVATTNGRLVDLTAQDTEADLKVDYTSGDLDTEAKVITAINATNAKINSIIEKLKALGLLATS